ncbi:10220_t:CDS:2 [Acaulospora colombiana]|uniref:10220_t:CDS:1 n=1 Tax=Acaulospora colombiana TaxID=27376 RepID=A0ACA9NG60_9GLOM|nr:10220_t:CDS:2 [Acaulospora colombiana]
MPVKDCPFIAYMVMISKVNVKSMEARSKEEAGTKCPVGYSEGCVIVLVDLNPNQVTVAPEESKRMVLSKGSSHGLIGSIPAGGQAQPSSTVGANAESKKAQNIEKKKQTSETINRMIPIVRPLVRVVITPMLNKSGPMATPWKLITPDRVVIRRAKEAHKGQGEG